MTIKRSAGPGGNKWGRPYLSSSKIVDGTRVRIDMSDAYQEDRDFGEGPKTVLNVPIELLDRKMIDNESKFAWTPGTMAASFLLDQIGEDESKWQGRTGHFDCRWHWETKSRSGYSTALVIDTSDELDKMSTPKQATAIRGIQAPSIRKNSFQCGVCLSSFGTATQLQEHIEARHT